MHYTSLPGRGLILVSGDDRESFLQGLVSNNVDKLKSTPAIYAALLSPQGKFLHDFFLINYQGGILIDCEKPRVNDLLQRLSLYKLRSKVEIKMLPELNVIVAWDGKTLPGFADPRLPQLGYRIVGESFSDGEKSTPGAYDAMRLSLGVPDGSRDMIVDKSFLLECHFEQLHGVDFTKGCYIGQEVTARSKHRGQVRKFLYQVKGESELGVPQTPVMFAEKEVGELRSSSGNIGLAIIRSEAAGEKLHANGKPITISLPDWASQ